MPDLFDIKTKTFNVGDVFKVEFCVTHQSLIGTTKSKLQFKRKITKEEKLNNL